MFKPNKINKIIRLYLITGFVLLVTACDEGMSEQKMLQNARTYLQQGDPKTAAIELRNTLKQNSENGEARYLLGKLNFDMGNYTGAEKELRQAELANWDQEEVQLALAQIFIATKKYQNLLDEIADNKNWNAETRANILALRALANAGQNNIPQASNVLDRALSIKADALHVLITTAMFQLASLRDGNIAETLQKARILYPDNTDVLLLQATQQIKNHHLTQADSTFKKVISLDPVNLISTNGRRARVGLARLQINQKDYDTADATLAPLLQRNNKDPEVNYLIGMLAFGQKNYNRAEVHLRETLITTPDHHPSQQLMGRVKYVLKNFEQAAHHLAEYLEAAPEDMAVRQLLTQTYIILNKPVQARNTLQKNLERDPDNAALLALLSQIEFNKGNINTGIQTLQRAIKSSPENISLRRQLIKAYISNEDTRQALDELKTFQKLSGNTNETQRLTISTYIKAGNFEKAITVAQKLMKKNPDNPDIIVINATLHASNNHEKQARHLFNKALQLQKNHPSATAGLARIEAKTGNTDKAIALYESLVDSDQSGTMPMLALSELAAQQKQVNDMLGWLEKARAIAPKETKARLILANYYLQNNQNKKANIYIQEAIKITPEQPELLTLQGKMLLSQKRYSEALPPLKRLVNKRPDSADAHALLSQALLRQGMTKNAREHLTIALQKQKDHALATLLMIEIEFKDGNFTKSLNYTKQLQAAKPEHSMGYMQEGNIWLARKKYKQAYSAFNKAWQYQQTAELAKKLFVTLKSTTTFDESITPLLTWLNTNPDDASTRITLATAYQAVGKNDKAIQEYEKTLEQTTDNSIALNNLAWLYSLKGNAKAIELAERAFRSAPEDAGIQDTYGWILVQQGQVDKGMRLIKQALETIPDNAEIRYHYATALIKSGSREQGAQILKKLLGENKRFDSKEKAQQLLESLEHR